MAKFNLKGLTKTIKAVLPMVTRLLVSQGKRLARKAARRTMAQQKKKTKKKK